MNYFHYIDLIPNPRTLKAVRTSMDGNEYCEDCLGTTDSRKHDKVVLSDDEKGSNNPRQFSPTNALKQMVGKELQGDLATGYSTGSTG